MVSLIICRLAKLHCYFLVKMLFLYKNKWSIKQFQICKPGAYYSTTGSYITFDQKLVLSILLQGLNYPRIQLESELKKVLGLIIT